MYGVYRSTRPMGPSERAHRRCAKKSAVAGLYMGMVMMGIGWRGPLIQEGAVNRALTSYHKNPAIGPFLDLQLKNLPSSIGIFFETRVIGRTPSHGSG